MTLRKYLDLHPYKKYHGNHGYHGTKTMKYIGSSNNVFHCFGTMITMVTMVDGNLHKKNMVTMVLFCKGILMLRDLRAFTQILYEKIKSINALLAFNSL